MPNTEVIFDVTPDDIARRLWDGFALIGQKAAARGIAIGVEELAARAMVMPSCGLGPQTVEVAERVFEVLPAVARRLREG
ncbi:MAG: hypothetical protein GX573_17805 [Chloroflexi bacterium]|nr:hypothetical protein [Chloroflexota bacterium]